MVRILLDKIVFLYKKDDLEEQEITVFRYRPLDKKGNALPAVWHLSCPSCHRVGLIDDDQFSGLVSIQCQCGFHETIDFQRITKETI